MKPARGIVIAGKILISLRHDRRTLILIILAPILAMFLFGFAFSGEVKDIKVVVLDRDEGFFIPELNTTVVPSDEVLSNLDGETIIVTHTDDYDRGIEMVRSGSANSLVYFPENFTRSLLIPSMEHGAVVENGSMEIRSDRSNVNIASAVREAFMEALSRTLEKRGYTSPLSIDMGSPVYGKGARFIDTFVPGIMGFVVFILTTLLTLISFVGEKTNGTLERLLASSVTEGEIVLGYASAFGLIGMFQVGVLLSLAILVFNVIVVGSPLLAFLIATLLAVVSVSLGILLSSLARRESQAIQFFPFLVIPAFLLSGVFWPLKAIPGWLRPLSYLIPITYAVDGIRSVLLRGWGISMIWFDLLMLVIFAIVFLAGAVATLRFRRR